MAVAAKESGLGFIKVSFKKWRSCISPQIYEILLQSVGLN